MLLLHVLCCLQLPTEYFLLCLGKNLKYSSCLYKSPQDSLEKAEEQMLGRGSMRAPEASESAS